MAPDVAISDQLTVVVHVTVVVKVAKLNVAPSATVREPPIVVVEARETILHHVLLI